MIYYGSCPRRRFSSAQPCLDAAFGSLEASPPTVLLLWLSLGLDEADSRAAAQALVQHLLHVQEPLRIEESAATTAAAAAGAASLVGPGAVTSGWTRRHWLTLIHLYLFDVLAAEMREPSELQRWLAETQLPLTEKERQALAAELELLLPTANSCPSPSASVKAIRDHSRASATVWVAAGARKRQLQFADKGGWQAAAQQEQGQQLALPHGTSSQSGSPGRDAAAELQLGAVGRCQQQLLLAARGLHAALLSRIRAVLARVGDPGGGTGAAVARQAMLGGVLGLVLAYSAWVERKALERSAQRARRGLLRALSDLGAMAFSLSVNPMVAADR